MAKSKKSAKLVKAAPIALLPLSALVVVFAAGIVTVSGTAQLSQPAPVVAAVGFEGVYTSTKPTGLYSGAQTLTLTITSGGSAELVSQYANRKAPMVESATWLSDPYGRLVVITPKTSFTFSLSGNQLQLLGNTKQFPQGLTLSR